MFKKVSTETLKTLADELSRIHAADASELEAAKYARTLSLLMLVELKNREANASGPVQPGGHKPA